MRRTTIIALCVLLAPWSHAEEPESTPAAETTTTEAKDTQPPAKAEDAADDEFIPTEQISEDASVPFPVDI